MNRILLKLTKVGDPLPVLSSKLFGMPDVWDEFEWPQPKTHPVSGYEYDIEFLCQINCAEAAKYDKDGILPKTGMLYYFDDREYRTEKGETMVFYYDVDLSKLSPYVTADEAEDCFDDDMFIFHDEYAIEFACNEYRNYKNKAPEGLGNHFLLGVPTDPEQMGFGAKEPPDKWQMLLQLQWDCLAGGSLMYICWFINKSDLANRDFSKAWVRYAHD